MTKVFSHRSVAVLLAIGWLTNGILHAEQATSPLTWEQAVQKAQQSNPDLLAAQRSVEASRANYKGSYNGVLPRLDLTNSYTRTKGDSDQSNRWSARGTASMDLFNVSRYASISASESGVRQSKANFQSVSSTILYRLKQAFANLLYAQESVEVSKRVLEIRQKNASLVSLRYDSGRESKGNRLRADAELLQAKASVNQSLRDKESSQQQLAQQLGDNTFIHVSATGTLSAYALPAEKPVLDPLIDNHPDVILQSANVESAEASVSQSKSVLWPTLSASYSKSLQDRDYFPDENPSWSAGSTLSVPIFGGGPTSAYYAVSESKRNRERAEENLRSTLYQVRSDLEESWSNFVGAVEQVGVQQAFLEASRQRNSEADVRYTNGLMSYDDWERIVTDRVNFETSVIRAERDAVIAEAQWNRSSGKGLVP